MLKKEGVKRDFKYFMVKFDIEISIDTYENSRFKNANAKELYGNINPTMHRVCDFLPFTL